MVRAQEGRPESATWIITLLWPEVVQKDGAVIGDDAMLVIQPLAVETLAGEGHGLGSQRVDEGEVGAEQPRRRAGGAGEGSGPSLKVAGRRQRRWGGRRSHTLGPGTLRYHVRFE